MNFHRKVFENADIVAATGLSATTIQTWANRGILMLTEQQRNPGVGQKRLYSAADIARIAVTKSLIDRGLSTSAAGQIALRLERSPQTRSDWQKALEQYAAHIHVFVDGTDVVRLYVGDQAEELARILTAVNEPSVGGFGMTPERKQLRAAVFDVGPEVSAAVSNLRNRYLERRYILNCIPADDGQAVLEAMPRFTGGKCLRTTFATIDQLVNTLAQGLALPAPQLAGIRNSLTSSQRTEIGGWTAGSELHIDEDGLINLGMPEE